MDVIIVGGGKVGADLAGLLLSESHAVRVLEVRPERVVELGGELPPDVVLVGSGTDPLVLEAAGIARADVLAAVTGTDEINLVAAGLARFEFGVRRTIARVNHPRNAWLFTDQMGVDEAVDQSQIVARLILEEMSLAHMMTLLKLQKGEYVLVEERVGSRAPAADRAVRDLDLPERCVLTGVIRGGELIPPRGATVLHAGDEVVALVHSDHAAELAALLDEGGS